MHVSQPQDHKQNINIGDTNVETIEQQLNIKFMNNFNRVGRKKAPIKKFYLKPHNKQTAEKINQILEETIDNIKRKQIAEHK